MLFNHSSGNENQIDVTSIFNSTNNTNASSFALAKNCNSFRINKQIYRRDNLTYSSLNNIAYIDWTSSDQDFNYILRNDKEIWRFNSTSNSY